MSRVIWIRVGRVKVAHHSFCDDIIDYIIAIEIFMNGVLCAVYIYRKCVVRFAVIFRHKKSPRRMSMRGRDVLCAGCIPAACAGEISGGPGGISDGESGEGAAKVGDIKGGSSPTSPLLALLF